ncbi:hypothetical protein BN1232_02751 [Mycobacterium lentiflavum]|uniref:Uncharacterized protein n=1 Tax=Mycobacterium lentiflavum TaxID=141349 RepID=A0A0E4GY14_MYCLN|nr:hypothetical protein BN1232_02751 [Mycobacterium lentiflavum]
MMEIVTGYHRESPLGFRVHSQIRGGARRSRRGMTESNRSGMAPSHTMAVHGRPIPALLVVIAALIGSGVAGATSGPMHRTAVGTANRAHSANISSFGERGWLLTGLIAPAPSGDITPDPPPGIPAPTAKPLEPPVAAPPPRAQQPQAPKPQPQAPLPQEQGPAPAPEAPPPQAPPPAPPPPPQPPPSPRPPGGHVQLSP